MSFIYQPDASATQILRNSKALVGNNTAGIQVPLFTLVGTVRIYRLFGVVTTVLGAIITNCYFQLNDSTLTPDITLATTASLAVAVGSMIQKTGLAATAAAITDAATGIVREPAAANTAIESMFEVTKKSGATTTVEFVYSTTAAPITGTVQFFVEYLPISADGSLTVI